MSLSVEWEGSKLDAKESLFTKLLCFPTSIIIKLSNQRLNDCSTLSHELLGELSTFWRYFYLLQLT
jgi:hypothetical protein